MLDTQLFKSQLTDLHQYMRSHPRGQLDSHVETQIVDELASIFTRVIERYQALVDSGQPFPGQPDIGALPASERTAAAMFSLLARMEADFANKFARDRMHGLEKDIEVGAIKISYLDGVRRSLRQATRQ